MRLCGCGKATPRGWQLQCTVDAACELTTQPRAAQLPNTAHSHCNALCLTGSSLPGHQRVLKSRQCPPPQAPLSLALVPLPCQQVWAMACYHLPSSRPGSGENRAREGSEIVCKTTGQCLQAHKLVHLLCLLYHGNSLTNNQKARWCSTAVTTTTPTARDAGAHSSPCSSWAQAASSSGPTSPSSCP